MAHSFITPGCIMTGEGALLEAAPRLAAMGKKALLVTDEMMVTLGNTAKVEQVLISQKTEFAVFTGISGEPSDTMIMAGLDVYQKEGCDFLIGIGGGSPLDAMKAIGALSAGGGKISDYMGKEMTMHTPPMAAIPTTAGTGSEATQFTIITDSQMDIKMLLKGRCLMPDLAVIDPQFTMTAPAAITAATGLDALTHAVEAYVSKKAQPLSDTFALSAVRRIFSYLPLCFAKGDNLKAREQMSIAALEAGIAFNNASVTIVHGMSRPIGALFHVPHGLSNAMLLKECLGFVLDGAYERFGALSRAVGAAGEGECDKVAAEKFLDAVQTLCQTLQTPTLAAYGIDKERFFTLIEKMSFDAMQSGSPQNSRKAVTEGDISALYQKLWQ